MKTAGAPMGVLSYRKENNMKVWRFDYYSKGAYRRKYVRAEDRDTAIKKSRLTRIVDLCYFDDTTERGQRELAGKQII